MSVRVNRHRFIGQVGQLCSWRGPGMVSEEPGTGAFCGLNYSASFHYNDDDHPFDGGEPAGASCVWEQQNVQLGVVGQSGNLFCWRPDADPVHHHGEDPAVTVRMEKPVPVNPWENAVMDKPLEDGMAWSRSPGADWEAPPPSLPQDSFAGQMASALRRGDVVASGPWPVRQWFAPDGGLPEHWEEPGELICGLNVLGESFSVHVWRATHEVRLVRVVWGVLLDVGFHQVADMVESWPE